MQRSAIDIAQRPQVHEGGDLVGVGVGVGLGLGLGPGFGFGFGFGLGFGLDGGADPAVPGQQAA